MVEDIVNRVELDWSAGDTPGEIAVTEDVIAVSVAVTGHTVVEIAIVEVTTVVESAGQLVTVGAQLVMVTSLVVYTVDVVNLAVVVVVALRAGVLVGDWITVVLSVGVILDEAEAD